MEKEWVPVVASLIGGALAVIGGILAGFFNRANLRMQLKHQAGSENKKIRVAKLEEAHELVTKFSHIQSKNFLDLIGADEEQKTRLVRKSSHDITDPLASIHSKIMIYAPELSDEWAKVINAVSYYRVQGTKYLRNKINQEDLLKISQDVKDPIFDFLQELEKYIGKISNQ